MKNLNCEVDKTMLSDEEREALQYFNTETKTEAMHYGAVLVKLIEKQSKEIEELKQEKEYLNCIIESDKDNYINKDKIKAKMKEKEWSLENYDCDKSDYKHSQAIGAWGVLQSLLEKE